MRRSRWRVDGEQDPALTPQPTAKAGMALISINPTTGERIREYAEHSGNPLDAFVAAAELEAGCVFVNDFVRSDPGFRLAA